LVAIGGQTRDRHPASASSSDHGASGGATSAMHVAALIPTVGAPVPMDHHGRRRVDHGGCAVHHWRCRRIHHRRRGRVYDRAAARIRQVAQRRSGELLQQRPRWLRGPSLPQDCLPTGARRPSATLGMAANSSAPTKVITSSLRNLTASFFGYVARVTSPILTSTCGVSISLTHHTSLRNKQPQCFGCRKFVLAMLFCVSADNRTFPVFRI